MPEMPVEAGFGTELLSHLGPQKVNLIIIRMKLKSRHRIEIHPLGNVLFTKECRCQNLKQCHEKNNGVWHRIVLLRLFLLHMCHKNGHWAQCWNGMAWRYPYEGCQNAPEGALRVVLRDSSIYRPVRQREWLLEITWSPAWRWSGISGCRVKSHPMTRETDASLNH